MASSDHNKGIAPPVLPGSISEHERHHLRLLRTLDAEMRRMIMDLTRRAVGKAVTDYPAHALAENVVVGPWLRG